MNRTKQIAAIGIFTALTAVITALVSFPTPGGGYLNIGDAVIFIASACMGPVGGMISGGIGSMIADLALGYSMYAPFTLIIKGLEGLICGVLMLVFTKLISKRTDNYVVHASVGMIAMLVAACEMVVLYFFAGWILGGYGAAIVDLPRSFLQGGISIIVGMLIVYALNLPKHARKFGFYVSVGDWKKKTSKDKLNNKNTQNESSDSNNDNESKFND